jgi:hypothetical protein
MKKEYYVKADFVKEHGHFKRNNTKIIFKWNEQTCSGSVIMLNPGSAEPKEGLKVIKEEPKTYISKKDFTLGFLANSLMEAYNKKKKHLSGYLAIVNLCDIKEKTKNLPQHSTKSVLDIKKEIPETTPWILIAWGKNCRQFDGLRKNILNKFHNDKIFGIKPYGYYMHPRGISTQGFKEELVKEIMKRLN